MKCDEQAPEGAYRVIGKDNPKDEGWLKGDYGTLSLALHRANPRGHATIRFRVFDDKGKCRNAG